MNTLSSENRRAESIDNQSEQDKHLIPIAMVFALLMVVLHVIGSFYPIGLLWGFHSFGFLPTPFLFGYIILSMFLLLYCVKGNIAQPLAALTNFMEKNPLQFLLLSWLFFIAGAMVFRIRVSLLGDSYTFLNNIENTLKGDHLLDLANEPIALSFYYLAAKVLGATSEPEIMNAVFTGELFLGCAFITVVYFTVKTVFSEKGDIRKILMLLYLGAMPYMQLFFGYAESYAVVLFMLSCTFLVTLLYLKGKISLWLVMPVFAVQFFVHYMGILLFPLVMYCVLWEFKEKKRSQILFGMLLSALVFGAILAAGNFHLGRFFRESTHNPILSVSEVRNQYEAYTLFSAYHALDLANMFFLMAPGTILLFVLGYSKKSTFLRSRLNVALLCGIVPFIVFILFAKFDLGMAKDWDVTVSYFYLFALFALIYFLQDIAPTKIRSACIVFVATILPACGYFQMNATENLSVLRTKSLMDQRVMSQSGLYQTSFHLSMYYFYEGLPDSMITIWKRYVSQYPKDTRAYEHMVKSYWETGERSYDDILKTYEQWLRVTPQDTTTRNAYASFCIIAGSAASKAGQDSEAVRYYNKSIMLNPRKAGAYNNLGIIYTQKSEYALAMSYFRTAISIDSMYARGYKNLASVYAATSHPDSAIPYFRKAIVLDPRYTVAYEQLATIYEALGRRSDALPLYQQAARLGSIPAQQFMTNNGLQW